MTATASGHRRGVMSALGACLAVALLVAAAAPLPAAATAHETARATATTRWAPLVRSTDAHVVPGEATRVRARISARTPEGTTTVVPVLGRATRSGTLWVKIGLPVLPNGTTGWVPRSALAGYGVSTMRLEISRSALRATLYRGTKAVFSAPIGVGRTRWPTPSGTFIVRNKLTKFASATYGPIAFGTSARSAVLTGWPAGGYIGIHGTDQPKLIPGRISHGCIRLRNADILRLAALMPVGTPVTID